MTSRQPQDGDTCRWGVVWTWDADTGRWCHSSGATMTHEQAVERLAGFDSEADANPVCLGSGASVGGVQGASGRGRKVTCPKCGRKVGMRPGRAGRLYPHHGQR